MGRLFFHNRQHYITASRLAEYPISVTQATLLIACGIFMWQDRAFPTDRLSSRSPGLSTDGEAVIVMRTYITLNPDL